MSEWREARLEDLCERVTVGFVGKMSDQYLNEGIPFLRSQNIQPFRIEQNGVLYIGEEFHQRIKKSTLRAGDVAVVRTGYPGTAAVIPPELDRSNCADLVVITPSPELNSHFLAAIFNSTWGKSHVGGQLVGSAQQHFNVGSAKAMMLRLPDRAGQDRIAEVLCSITDLIENNRRRIEVLEEMAQAIYREWFVDLRYPGHENATFVDSPLGLLPEGWEVRNLFDVADVGFGFSFKSKHFADSGEHPVVRIRDVPKGTTATFSDEPVDDRYRVDDGDVLIGMDGDFHLRQWTGGTAWLNQRVARLRPSSGLSARHLQLAIASPIKRLNESIAGTTVAHLGKRHLELIEIAVPSTNIRDIAQAIFDNFSSQECALFQANMALSSIRDMLLPRLVTGQIDVSGFDLDALLGAAP